MNKKILIAISLMISTTLFISCQNENIINEDTKKVIDVYNREVAIPKNSNRYVCIGPNALRLYTYIADANNIVGIENFEKLHGTLGRPYILKYQNIIDDLPIIGEGGPKSMPNAELILLSNPDVIFMSNHYDLEVINQIYQATQIPIIVISHDTADGRIFNDKLIKSLDIIGKITQNEQRANELIDYLNSQRDYLINKTKDIKLVKNAYIGSLSKAGRQLITSTSGDYEIFDMVNVKNISQINGIKNHAIIDKETLLSWNPNIIFIDANGYELLLEDKKDFSDYYDSLNAFAKNQVYLQMPYNYYSTNIEIAIANAYYTASVIYPELFNDLNIEEKTNDIAQFFLGIDIYDFIQNDYYGGYQKINQ